MAYAAYPKTRTDLFCLRCGHTNPAEDDNSCSAFGYNGVDCSPQPCVCRSHFLDSKAEDFARCGFREKENSPDGPTN